MRRFVLSFAFLTLIAGGGGAFYLGHRLLAAGYFRLETVEYHGARNFDTEAFNDLMLKAVGRDLVGMDPDRVRELVESETWVKHAVVRRQFPARLHIYISEREPVAVAAIDSDLFVVDDEGKVLDAYGPRYEYLDRPILKGLQNTAREDAAEQNQEKVRVYLQVVESFRDSAADYSQAISEIDVATPKRVAVVPTEEPVLVYLGDADYRQRFERFLSQREVYQRLKERYGLVEYVDVTFENKVIFHTPSEPGTAKEVKGTVG